MFSSPSETPLSGHVPFAGPAPLLFSVVFAFLPSLCLPLLGADGRRLEPAPHCGLSIGDKAGQVVGLQSVQV